MLWRERPSASSPIDSRAHPAHADVGCSVDTEQERPNHRLSEIPFVGRLSRADAEDPEGTAEPVETWRGLRAGVFFAIDAARWDGSGPVS
jgi:hypothetical protein